MSACTARCDSLLAQLTAWGPVLRHAADVQIVGEAPLELLEVSEITAAGLAALRGLQKHLRSAAQPPENGLFLVNPDRLPDAADLAAVTAATTALVAKGPGPTGAIAASLALAVAQELQPGHVAFSTQPGVASYGLFAKVRAHGGAQQWGAHPDSVPLCCVPLGSAPRTPAELCASPHSSPSARWTCPRSSRSASTQAAS